MSCYVKIIYFYMSTVGKQANVKNSNEYDKYLNPFLLFAHAFVGCDTCDTTSTLFSIGSEKRIDICNELYKVADKIIKHLYGQSNNNFTIGDLKYSMCTSNAPGLRTGPIHMWYCFCSKST